MAQASVADVSANPRAAGQSSPARYPVLLICAVTNFTAVRRAIGEPAWALFASTLCNESSLYGMAQLQQTAPDCFEIVSEAQSLAEARDVATRFADVVRRAGSKLLVDLNVAIGGALDEHGLGALAMREQSEAALADACWGNRIEMRSVGAVDDAIEEMALVEDLRHATRRREFFLLYQPKLNVRDNCITSAEALIRWLHPTRGLIMPDAFISLADESGDIVQIARWTLDQVLEDQRHLRGLGHELCLFINISGRLLMDGHFIEEACGKIRAAGGSIGFEITETSVIRDPEIAIANLQRCHDAGITIAIDDYGSGLSSLSYLKRLPAHELKIDKQFIMDLTSSHRDPLIVRSTIDLAHALDMVVTAEGVEAPAALALLGVMGCDLVQGYLISMPQPLSKFADELANSLALSPKNFGGLSVQQPASFWKRAS